MVKTLQFYCSYFSFYKFYLCSMVEYRKNSHTISRMSCHLVWATKYGYHILKGDIQSRCRDILIQSSNNENVHIQKGVVSKNHIHMHIEYAPSLSISMFVKKLKGRSSCMLQQEFPELGKKYWSRQWQ